MLNCPVCKNMSGTVNPKLTELESETMPGNLQIEIVYECSVGHEFTVVYYTTIVHDVSVPDIRYN